jgi:hypothetical protein
MAWYCKDAASTVWHFVQLIADAPGSKHYASEPEDENVNQDKICAFRCNCS